MKYQKYLIKWVLFTYLPRVRERFVLKTSVFLMDESMNVNKKQISETWWTAQPRPGGHLRPGAGLPDTQHHWWPRRAEPQPWPGLSDDRSLSTFSGIVLIIVLIIMFDQWISILIICWKDIYLEQCEIFYFLKSFGNLQRVLAKLQIFSLRERFVVGRQVRTIIH